MKKIILVFTVLSLSSLAFSQERKEKDVQVPKIVEKAFQRDFPNLKVKWENENGKYEGAFKLKGQEMSALYNEKGILEEKEVEIKTSELPLKVSQYVSKNKLGKIKEAAKIVHADGLVNYEAEIEGGDALFDAKGNFLRLVKD